VTLAGAHGAAESPHADDVRMRASYLTRGAQPEVARRIAESGAGVAVALERLSARSLRGAVREAMTMRPAVEWASRRLHAFGARTRVPRQARN
jgi:UDP:flavonoid glycosyltransferase YjiC (YdhE family)